MDKLSKTLSEQKGMLSDGAWGTSLQAKGLGVGQSPEIWNMQKPDLVQSVAAEYIAAGAQMVKTNSFGGNRFKLAASGIEDRTAEINEEAAKCSRAAAGSDVYVLGSIGPTGKMLIVGDVTEDELYEAFSQQAAALARGGADVILIETMTDLQEAKIAVTAAKDATNLEIACTMTFQNNGGTEYRTMMGVSPTEMVKELKETNISFIGSNCGNGIEQMIPIVEEIRSADPILPIIIHANAGMPVLIKGKTVFPEDPETMAASVPALIKAGANIIGGCCGTTPEHIKEMSRFF